MAVRFPMKVCSRRPKSAAGGGRPDLSGLEAALQASQLIVIDAMNPIAVR